MHHNSSDLHVALTIFCLAAPADSRFAALDCTREVRTHKSSLAPLKRRPVSDLLLRTAPWNRSSESLGCPLIQIGPLRQKPTIQRKSRRVQFLMFQRPNTGRVGGSERRKRAEGTAFTNILVPIVDRNALTDQFDRIGNEKRAGIAESKVTEPLERPEPAENLDRQIPT